MDVASLARTIGALGFVLGLLGGALWFVRRYGLKLPGRIGGVCRPPIELIERLSLDNRRTLSLIRRDQDEFLVLSGPDGSSILRCAAETPAAPRAADPPPSSIDERRPFARHAERIIELRQLRDIMRARHA